VPVVLSGNKKGQLSLAFSCLLVDQAGGDIPNGVLPPSAYLRSLPPLPE